MKRNFYSPHESLSGGGVCMGSVVMEGYAKGSPLH